MASKKRIYFKYLLYAVIITTVFVLSTALIEKVILQNKGSEGGDNPLSTIFGIFGSVLFLQAFITGLPSIQKYLKNKYSMNRKEFLNLHCDVATTATFAIILHVIFGSLLLQYSGRFYWYSIYPWFYTGFAESWNNLALSLTLGSWALFFMIIATIAGYYKKWIYKHYSRTTFIVIQNLTIISLINLTLHEITIGDMTQKNIIVNYLIIVSAVILIGLWIWYNVQMIGEKSKSEKKQSIITSQ